METRVKDVVDSLEMGIDDDVWMIGIKGMGGAGKTTTARAVFDRLSADFEAKSFVANVREVSKPSMSGLKKLQKQVLSDVMKEEVTVNDVTHGKNMMQKRMCAIKVLLVLDDVSDIDQLVALAGETNWFKKGSRIIVTTRDEQVLQAHRVNFRDIDKVDHRVKIRDIDLLSDEEAIFLFSRHAFGRAIPSQGFKKLSEKVVSYAAGLPLTLKVLGSFLCGKDEREWKDAIERLKEIPLPEEIQEKLELSYTSLEKDYKEIFLDIACILKGKHKEEAIRILECCGFRAINGLKVLEQRSLITVNEDGFLGMHDHIEEMGKNIVRRLHPGEPNEHSRLWINEEIEDILANDEGTKKTICLELRNSNTNAGIVMKGLGKMKQLRHLQVDLPNQDYYGNAEDLDNTAQYFSNSLKYLKFSNYPFLYLPKTFQANNLVGLEIAWSRRMEQLWEEGEKKVLPKLKFLSLSNSKLTTFDFRITPKLETLSLQYSFNLVKLFMPVSCQKLNYLYISSSKLRTFDLGLTPNLEKLSLNDCADFEELHVSSACPNLKFLELGGKLRLRSLDLELFPNLEKLDLHGCVDFEELHVSSACPNLKFLHVSSACPNLKFLELGGKLRLRSLDLELFPNLEKLSLNDCADFEELHVSSACPNLKFLELGGKLRLRSLDLELFPNLEKLDLHGCVDFEELHVSSACPNLKFLHVSSACPNLKFLELGGKLRLRSLDLELFPNLEKLSLNDCADFEELHVSSACPNLKFLELGGKLRLRSLDLELFPNLEKLYLKSCVDFEELHVSSACPNLKFLELGGKLRLRSLDLELFPNLERLDLEGSDKLVEFNATVGCLRKLVYLNLASCLWFSNFVVFIGELGPKVSHSSASLRVGKSLDLRPLHPNINLPKFQFNCEYEENLPSLAGNNEKLISFGLCACTDFKKFSDMNCSLRCRRKLELKCGIPECTKDLGQLECLEEFTKMKHLPWEELTEDLEKLPDDIGQLECLEKLYLKGKEIKHLRDSICMLKCLKFLVVNTGNLLGNLLEKLLENLGQLECLERLHVRGEKIKHLPDSICMLKCLKCLEVDTGDLLEKLPENLGQLECLEQLYVSKKIEYLPDSICMLKRLKSLDVRDCSCLGKFPEDIGQLECLERLHVRSKKIKHLPDSICMLKCLKCLEVDTGYLLEKLPENLGQLECLEQLYVRSKRIEYLPDSICKLKRLKLLDFGDCSCLGKLPEGIGQLESLERLDLTATMIKHLPDSICELKHLTHLILSRCTHLQKLPEDLGKLECFKNLHIAASPFTIYLFIFC